jgi:quercetin dioxygenase-like cupin family protein
MQRPALNDRNVASAAAGPPPPAGRRMRRGILGGALAATAASLLPLRAGSAVQSNDPALRTNPAEETIALGPLSVRFLVTADESAGSMAAFEVIVPARQRLAAPPHSHDHYEETIYGLSGVLTWTVNGSQLDVGPGQALCIPRGAVHRFDNHGDVDVRALCVITPAAIGPLFFRESAEVLNASAGGPPDPARMIAVMRRHGITPARP